MTPAAPATPRTVSLGDASSYVFRASPSTPYEFSCAAGLPTTPEPVTSRFPLEILFLLPP